MKIVRNILIGILIVLVVLAGTSFWLVRRPWPEVSGTNELPGLSDSVRVVRDAWGVPHIYAQNEHDLFMAQGYVHAQDRLWQMHYNRLASNGVASSVLGERGLEYDKFVRTIGMRRAAEQEWQRLNAEEQAILQAYADGVNAFIETHRDRLPIEFTLLGVQPHPWTPIDSLAYGYVISFSLAGNHRLEYLRSRMIAQVGEQVTNELLTAYGSDKPLIIPPEAQGYQWMRNAGFSGLDAVAEMLGDPGASWGSNNWVVHGSRTASGKPLLANDTHLNLSMPSIWYANGLHGGRFDSMGFTFPGVPALLLGRNNRIAWGVTNLNPDVQDLYIEKLDNPENPTQYEFQGEWYPLEVITETIQVKGQDPVTLPVYLTKHGPIINGIFDQMKGAEPMSFQWAAYGEGQLFKSLVAINLAQNWEEFRQAVRLWQSPSQNFVYADVEGNIGYQMSGLIPIRATNHSGLVPVPGWTGEYEWQSYIPFEQLPHVLNPSAGFIATANNKVVSDDYPYFLSYEWDPGFRAKRITDLLTADDQVTIEDIQQIHADTYSLPAEELRPYLLMIQPENDKQKQALQYVQNWDLRLETDRVGASIYESWYWFLLRNTLNDDLGDEMAGDYLAGQYERHGSFQVPAMLAILEEGNDSHWFDDKTTPQVETREEIMRKSLNDALEWLRENYGEDMQGWTWGRLHAMTFASAGIGRNANPFLAWVFNVGPIPARGDNFTVNAASFSFDEPFRMNHGASQRMIVDLSDPDNMRGILTTGQTAHAFHPHRADMIPLWQNIEYIPFYASQAKVEANADAVLTLTPSAGTR